MESGLIKITALTRDIDITSRTLRYYEQIGLIKSVRPAGEKYRYYDTHTVERLRQIIVLRKMQIPVKDIIHIYESRDMSALVEAFVKRINSIDAQVTALSEMKRIINEFLQAMMQSGITHISALPLLYEEMEKQLTSMEQESAATYEQLAAVSERLERAPEVRILALPAMRVLTSLRKEGQSDPEGFWNWLYGQGLPIGMPGERALFEYQDAELGTVLLQRVGEDFENDSPYVDDLMPGSHYAVAGLYVDEDMSAFYHRMVHSFDDNPYYEIDYAPSGTLRFAALLETVLSPDRQRERVDLYIPVKERVVNAALYAPGERVEGISVAEIEASSPVLWSRDIPMDGFTPLMNPRYRMTETGEAEYMASIPQRVLSTEVPVRIPFRVDVEFRLDESTFTYANGSSEGSIRLYHGGSMCGVNMGNYAQRQEWVRALAFTQPVIGGYTAYAGLGSLRLDAVNTVTWIVGEAHYAVLVNGEVRYCGIHFPYMAMDLRTLPEAPIRIGSDGKGSVYFRRMRVSQLRQMPKARIKEGELTMAARQSNNMIPNIHRLITSHYGENFWFNGAARYVMEALGEPEMDYWFFSGLTGDSLAQVYSYDRFRGDGALDYRLSDGSAQFVLDVFEACGYAATFVGMEALHSNPEMYLQTLMAYIDKGVPIIVNLWRTWDGGAHGFGWGVFVGYEDYGKTLLYLTDNSEEPARLPSEVAVRIAPDEGGKNAPGWFFLGDKKRQVDLAQVYRDAVLGMPRLLTHKTGGYCFGGEAFRAWADSVEGGRFDGMQPADFDEWPMYKVYVCDVATNGSCRAFLERALAKNPDMGFLSEVLEQYKRLSYLWTGLRDKSVYDGPDLESLGGGFNVTLEVLQDKDKRAAVAAVMRLCADCMDRVMDILAKNIPTK